jgi:hypothetical protein
LAALNTVLTVVCVIGFFGIQRITAAIVGPNIGLTLLSCLLLPVFACLFVVAWVLYGQRLGRALTGWRDVLPVAVVGAAPLFGLALIGYAAVGYILLQEMRAVPDPAGMRGTSLMIYGVFATLVLLAALACTAVIVASSAWRVAPA